MSRRESSDSRDRAQLARPVERDDRLELVVFANLGEAPFDNNLLPVVASFARLGRSRSIHPRSYPGFHGAGGAVPAAIPAAAVEAALDGPAPDAVICLGGGLVLEKDQIGRFPRRPVLVGIALSDPLGLEASLAIAPGFDLFYTQDPQTLAVYREKGIAARRLDIAVDPDLMQTGERPTGLEPPLRDVIFYGKWTAYRDDVVARLAAELRVGVFAHEWERARWSVETHPSLDDLGALAAEISRSRLALELALLWDAPPPWRGSWRITYRPFFAAACAVPSLVEASPRLAELFEPGVEIATFTDPSSVVAAASRLLEDDERLQAMGAAARKRLLAAHTWERRAREVLTDIRSILRRGDRGA